MATKAPTQPAYVQAINQLQTDFEAKYATLQNRQDSVSAKVTQAQATDNQDLAIAAGDLADQASKYKTYLWAALAVLALVWLLNRK